MRKLPENYWPALAALLAIGLLLHLVVGTRFFGSAITEISSAPIQVGPTPLTMELSSPLRAINERAGLYLLLAHPSAEQFSKIIIEDRMRYDGADKFRALACDKVMSCVPLQAAGIALGKKSVEAVYRGDWEKLRNMQIDAIVVSADVPREVLAIHWESSGK